MRSAYLSAAGRLFTVTAPGVHILNGHGLAIGNPSLKSGRFGSLLAALRNECEFVRIEDAVALIQRRESVTETLVAFTFDDGYAECFVEIAPELDRHDVNAAFFVNPGFIDGDSAYRGRLFDDRLPDFYPREPMTWGMLRDLRRSGFVVGSHTRDHQRLVGLSADELHRQLVSCRYRIERELGDVCEYFAWTYGRFSDIDPEALTLAKKTYRYVFSSDSTRADTSSDHVINRRHFECDWPVSHVRYFLGRKRQIRTI